MSKQLRTLSLSKEHLDKLEALMIKFMGASSLKISDLNKEILEYVIKESDTKGTVNFHNWLYITMVLLPQYIGDWHLDANWMVTHMTAKKFKHPIDYLYEKYIE